MKASQQAVDLIKRFEGFRSTPYICAGGRLTIGYGTTDCVTPGCRMTEPEAEAALRKRLAENDRALATLLRQPLAQHQYDAVASLVYNIGTHAFGDSTLLKFINSARFENVPQEFLKWRRGGKLKKVIPGLSTRRIAEAKLWLGDRPKAAPPVVALEPHSPFAREAVREGPSTISITGLWKWIWQKLRGKNELVA